MTTKERFLDKVLKVSGCWIWVGGSIPKGYGVFRLDGETILAHRASYKLWKGKIPKNIHVCHSCDNPGCVNPKHLFLGTAKQNAEDKMKKGRWKGGRPRFSDEGLTPDQVEKRNRKRTANLERYYQKRNCI